MTERPAGVIVTGPNHALHFILTLLTFWLFGGWVWVWLIIAIRNKRTIQVVDQNGNLPAERMNWWPAIIAVTVLIGIALLIA